MRLCPQSPVRSMTSASSLAPPPAPFAPVAQALLPLPPPSPPPPAGRGEPADAVMLPLRSRCNPPCCCCCCGGCASWERRGLLPREGASVWPAEAAAVPSGPPSTSTSIAAAPGLSAIGRLPCWGPATPPVGRALLLVCSCCSCCPCCAAPPSRVSASVAGSSGSDEPCLVALRRLALPEGFAACTTSQHQNFLIKGPTT